METVFLIFHNHNTLSVLIIPNNYGLIKTMYIVNVFVIWKESTPISIDIISIMTKSFEKYNTTF